MKRILILPAVLLIASCCSAEARPTLSPAEKQIFDQLNQEREKAGLPDLEWNDHAAEAARNHSGLLAENAQLSHQFPGEPVLPERLGATGVRFTVSAENVARTEYVEDVNLALMGSAGHRANMLNPQYNAVGIGVVEQKGKIYVTQDFVFLVPVYTEAQFSAAFAAAVNLARTAKRVREIDVRLDPSLHGLACSTDGNAMKLSDRVGGASSLVVFTSSDPHHLPEQMLGRAANSDFHRLTLGVCFRPEEKYGYANFWVVAAFAN